jgi:hypothetical protein
MLLVGAMCVCARACMHACVRASERERERESARERDLWCCLSASPLCVGGWHGFQPYTSGSQESEAKAAEEEMGPERGVTSRRGVARGHECGMDDAGKRKPVRKQSRSFSVK